MTVRNEDYARKVNSLEGHGNNISRRSGSRSPLKSPSPTPGSGNVDERDSQIDFLNSIIVDMQRKNDEYRAKIQILETTPLEFSKSPLPVNGKTSVLRAPPRMFCDICEVFDRHETEDCPKQATDYNDHSKFGGVRGPSSRPYCDNCEVFGHANDECDNEEF